MIKNLEEKLDGLLPVTRIELIELISSWGRISCTNTFDKIDIETCQPKECYPLENLDVSKIKCMDSIFRYSMYNGDLSKWNVNNVQDMNRIFSRSLFNNDSIKYWNISNVKTISFAFWGSEFNGDISKWDISRCTEMKEMFAFANFDGNISNWEFNNKVFCYDIFCDNKKFSNKYNNGKEIPNSSEDFLIWFEKNKNKIRELNVSKEEVLDFFSFDNQKELKKYD